MGFFVIVNLFLTCLFASWDMETCFLFKEFHWCCSEPSCDKIWCQRWLGKIYSLDTTRFRLISFCCYYWSNQWKIEPKIFYHGPSLIISLHLLFFQFQSCFSPSIWPNSLFKIRLQVLSLRWFLSFIAHIS
jgi:hypothetical protein